MKKLSLSRVQILGLTLALGPTLSGSVQAAGMKRLDLTIAASDLSVRQYTTTIGAFTADASNETSFLGVGNSTAQITTPLIVQPETRVGKVQFTLSTLAIATTQQAVTRALLNSQLLDCVHMATQAAASANGSRTFVMSIIADGDALKFTAPAGATAFNGIVLTADAKNYPIMSVTCGIN